MRQFRQKKSSFKRRDSLPIRRSMKAGISRTLMTVAAVLYFANAQAQDDTMKTPEADTVKKEEYRPFAIGGHIKNMHTWHGFVVQPGAMFATNLEYSTKNKKFTFGFWGGASFYGSDVWNESSNAFVSANYKEFSIYAVYRFSDRFFTELVTHNNYTGVEERGETLHYWSYDRETSYNFPDLNFGYNFDRVSLYWGVILFGQAMDYEEIEGVKENSWTQYAEVKGTLYEKGDYKLTAFVGGAWSTFTDKTFYTQDRGNVINVGTTLRKNVQIGNYATPVEVTAMWNPEKEITVLQLDIALF